VESQPEIVVEGAEGRNAPFDDTGPQAAEGDEGAAEDAPAPPYLLEVTDLTQPDWLNQVAITHEPQSLGDLLTASATAEDFHGRPDVAAAREAMGQVLMGAEESWDTEQAEQIRSDRERYLVAQEQFARAVIRDEFANIFGGLAAQDTDRNSIASEAERRARFLLEAVPAAHSDVRLYKGTDREAMLLRHANAVMAGYGVQTRDRAAGVRALAMMPPETFMQMAREITAELGVIAGEWRQAGVKGTALPAGGAPEAPAPVVSKGTPTKVGETPTGGKRVTSTGPGAGGGGTRPTLTEEQRKAGTFDRGLAKHMARTTF